MKSPEIICVIGRVMLLSASWEKVNRGISKPGGFLLFSGKDPDCVADPFGTVPRRCFIAQKDIDRPRKRKRTNREIPGKIGKLKHCKR